DGSVAERCAALEGAQRFAGLGVPQLDEAFLRAGDDSLAVGAEVSTDDVFLLARPADLEIGQAPARERLLGGPVGADHGGAVRPDGPKRQVFPEPNHLPALLPLALFEPPEFQGAARIGIQLVAVAAEAEPDLRGSVVAGKSGRNPSSLQVPDVDHA